MCVLFSGKQYSGEVPPYPQKQGDTPKQRNALWLTPRVDGLSNEDEKSVFRMMDSDINDWNFDIFEFTRVSQG